MKTDIYYMKKAVELAKKGDGKTNPNPVVGAVLVKGNKIVGKGYHKSCGLPHAEAEAINDAGRRAIGATLYVTLEPCSSFGRMPPCTNLIVASGIRKVLIATKDPNPVNKNKGIAYLKKSGIEVKLGLMEKEARTLNRIFEKLMGKGMPFVTAKIAQSLDGKIATATGESRWITGPDSRRYVHRLRSRVDAVLVGVNTVLKDDPLLTNRLYRKSNKQPLKIVLDSRLRIPPESKIFSKGSPSGVILATTSLSSGKKRKFFESAGVRVLVVKTKKGKTSLKDLMKKLAKMNIAHILVEGGSGVLSSFLEEELIDRILFFMSQKIIGGADSPSPVMGNGIKRLAEAKGLRDTRITRFKEDFLVEGYLN